MKTFLLVCNVFCVFASAQDQNGDSPFMVNDGNIFKDKTLDFKFPDGETEGDSEIQNEFSGGISSQDGSKSTETIATTTTATTITTTATTTTATTATKTTAATTTATTITATTTTATTTTTTTASTTSEIPKAETQSELSLNDDLEIDLDDSDNPDNSDLAIDDSEENVLVKDNTGSDSGPIDNIYDLLEPDQQDNLQKNSSSEEPLYDISDTDKNNSVLENQENQELDTVSGSESQEPSEEDPQVVTANGSVQLIAIIVGVVVVLLIIATSIFMIRRKRVSSQATYNITTAETATRKPREAHI